MPAGDGVAVDALLYEIVPQPAKGGTDEASDENGTTLCTSTGYQLLSAREQPARQKEKGSDGEGKRTSPLLKPYVF